MLSGANHTTISSIINRSTLDGSNSTKEKAAKSFLGTTVTFTERCKMLASSYQSSQKEPSLFQCIRAFFNLAFFSKESKGKIIELITSNDVFVNKIKLPEKLASIAPITIATFKAPEVSVQSQSLPADKSTTAASSGAYEFLTTSRRYETSMSLLTEHGFHAASAVQKMQCICADSPSFYLSDAGREFTDQQVSYLLSELHSAGKSAILKNLDLANQPAITSIDLTSLPNIENIQLNGCIGEDGKPAKYIILGNAEKLQHINGLNDLPGTTFFCAKFNPDDTRLMEAFAEALPGTIICTAWRETMTGDGENVNKTLTPLLGYRKTDKKLWEKVEWNQGQQAAEQPPDSETSQAPSTSEEHQVPTDSKNETQATAEPEETPGVGVEKAQGPAAESPTTDGLASTDPRGAIGFR
jgi:hypothetical protein